MGQFGATDLLGAVLPRTSGVHRTRVRHGHIVTYHFPGRWMRDDELSRLRGDLERIALERLGDLPGYGVILPGREPYENRIISLLYREGMDDSQAFSAMARCPVRIDGSTKEVINLGLVVAGRATTRGSSRDRRCSPPTRSMPAC